MSALRWIYERVGQMLCFGLGGAMVVFLYISEYSEPPIGKVAAGLGLLATGLVLRAQQRR